VAKVQTRQPVGQSRSSLLPEIPPGTSTRCRQGQGAVEGSRRHRAGERGLHGAEGCWKPKPKSPRVIQPDGGGDRLRHEDQGSYRSSRPAETGRKPANTTQAYMLAWSGRIDPDGNSYISQKTEARCRTTASGPIPDADKALDGARPSPIRATGGDS